jgi:hypothetical protein
MRGMHERGGAGEAVIVRECRKGARAVHGTHLAGGWRRSSWRWARRSTSPQRRPRRPPRARRSTLSAAPSLRDGHNFLQRAAKVSREVYFKKVTVNCMHKVGFVLFAHPNSSQTVANLGMAQLSVPVVSSEPPRPRNRDRSVCGPDAPHLGPSCPFPTQPSLPYRVPSGQFPQWSVSVSFSSGQFPQWSVSLVVSGQCRSVSPVVSFPSGQFPQWSVSLVVSGQCRSVSPVVSFSSSVRPLKQARLQSPLSSSSSTSSRRGQRSGQCPR